MAGRGATPTLTPAQWQHVDELYELALAKPELERGTLLAECDDAAVRGEVESLLRCTPNANAVVAAAIGNAAERLATNETIIGRRVGAYRLIALLGEGGMGTVYLANRDDAEFRREVAIKVLRHGLASPEAIARFRDERQILAELDHPGIVRLLDGGTHDGLPYIVMEKVAGVPITQYARDLSTRDRIALVRKVCDALEYAHAKHVIHRDIKPSNVLVTADGQPKLLDFGIAKLGADGDREANTRTGVALLTPAYASPEQARGEPVNSATDVYSLGAVLYELLTDRPPLEPRGNPLEVVKVISDVDPVRPSSIAGKRSRELAGDLDNILLKTLHKDADRRYQSVEQLEEDLGRFLDGKPVLARPPTLGYRATKLIRRHGRKAAAAAILCAVIYIVASRGVSAPSTETSASVDGTDAPLVRERRLTSFDGRAAVGAMAMDRAGKRIAYCADGHLWVRALDAAKPERVDVPAALTATMRVLDFFPDGQRLFVRTGRPGAWINHAIDLRDHSVKTLATTIQDGQLSPAGDRIAYFNGDGVMVSALDGTKAIRLKPSVGGFQLAWSPDSRWVAAVSPGVHAGTGLDKARIVVMAADGSRSSEIPMGAPGDPLAPGLVNLLSGIAWNDPRRIVYARVSHHATDAALWSFDTELCSLGIVEGSWDAQPPRCVGRVESAVPNWLWIAGGHLAFVRNAFTLSTELATVDASVVGPRRSLRGQEGQNNIWSMTLDGHILGTSRSGGRVTIQHPDDAAPRVLAGVEGAADDSPVAIGDAIVFTRTHEKTCELIRDRHGKQEVIRSTKRDGNCPYLRCALAATPRCVIVRGTDTHLVIQRFDIDAGYETGPERRRPTIGDLLVDLSRDGSTLAWAIEDEQARLALLDVDTGEYRELRPKGSLRLRDVSWLPGTDGWLVSGQDPDRATRGFDVGAEVVARLRPDGTYDHWIVEDRPMRLFNPLLGADGRTLALTTVAVSTDVYVLDGFE